ncbi:hypothetical protein CYMTET_18318, partial [Cymbomonas tetramitiformis]
RNVLPRIVAKASETLEAGVQDAATSEFKDRLLKLAAVTCRGSEATTAQRDEAAHLVSQLGEIGNFDSNDLSGSWQLVMSSTFPFRSSPFFWAIGEMMGGTADFFYSAHEHQTSLFGVGIGEVIQTIDLDEEELVSDVVVKAGLGIPLVGFAPIVSGRGRVITSASLRLEDGASLTVTVKQTALNGGPEAILPALNGTTVPVATAMSALNSGAVPEVTFKTDFVDDTLRVSSLPDGSWFAYIRQ